MNEKNEIEDESNCGGSWEWLPNASYSYVSVTAPAAIISNSGVLLGLAKIAAKRILETNPES